MIEAQVRLISITDERTAIDETEETIITANFVSIAFSDFFSPIG
jgi:hypothetical protein